MLGLFFAIAISVLIYIFRMELVKLQGYGYFGVFVLNALGSATIFLPAPLFLSAVTAATFMNPLGVGLVSSLGSSLGELTGYMAGIAGRGLVAEDPTSKRVYGWMSLYGAWAMLAIAAIPNPFFDIAGLFAGATKMPIPKFLLVIWIGKLFKFTALAYFGSSLILWIQSWI